MVKQTKAERVENRFPLWELEIEEVEGRSLEKRGRENINEMLSQGWIMLYIYTLRYKDDNDTWIERPMAILGRPANPVKKRMIKRKYPEVVIH